ncbi:tRNA dihydrouridine synthase DusB [Melioribacter sp. Ez-97]|jgi:tRNA-dihydrouridine synthase B|uniref:tRNA dihydrouridine synthase DusB n=1 Tax=Melioribacter sp. Ez-97 TaxID=3423434 RepID=UPI003EDA9B69
MFKVGNIELNKPLLLAPMEDVTDIAFRKLCKEFGADIVYTEFVNSDGLVRSNKKTHRKMEITEQERPVGIQIYGGNLEPMVESAKIVEALNPDIIDINAGCWVKKVANRGAGAGLLKDPEYMGAMVKEIVRNVKLPVTVKTRIGWDETTINIQEVAKRIEDAGAAALTIHCRTRSQGHSGEPDWSWIDRVKEVVSIPVILNGGIFSAEDVKRAFETTSADGVMIARGAIERPWIFREAKELLEYGEIKFEDTPEKRFEIALRHLKYSIELKNDERTAIIPFRKFWSGYLKGLKNSSHVKREMMQYTEYAPIEDLLMRYLEELKATEDQLSN